jgi:hypothetical protein
VKQFDPATLDDIAENPRMPDLRSTVAETLLQIIMHSQNHRGQALMVLRQLTGNAPTLDFIWWVKLGHPNPVRVSNGEPRTASKSLWPAFGAGTGQDDCLQIVSPFPGNQ